MYSPFGDNDIIAVALLSEYKERAIFTDIHEQEQIPLVSTELEDSIISTFNWITSFDKQQFCKLLLRKKNNKCYRIVKKDPNFKKPN